MGRVKSFMQFSKNDQSDIMRNGRTIEELLRRELIIYAKSALDNVDRFIEIAREEYSNRNFRELKGKYLETLEVRAKKLRSMAEILSEVVVELENYVNKLGESRGLVDSFKKVFSGINIFNDELKAKIKREPAHIKTNLSLDESEGQLSKIDLSDIIIKGRKIEELLKNELLIDAELALKNVNRLIIAKEEHSNSNRNFKKVKREYIEELEKHVQKFKTTVELFRETVIELENELSILGKNKDNERGDLNKRKNLQVIYDGIKGMRPNSQEISVTNARGLFAPNRDVH